MPETASLGAALAGLGLAPDPGLERELLSAYSGPGRYYHTFEHVEACLAVFRQFDHLAQRPHEIEIALWFHDAVYDTHRDDNESRSADWAAAYLDERGVDDSAIERIAGMIRATQHHATADPDTALLLDVDLSILGMPQDVFRAYDAAIRKEFGWVPEAQFRDGRKRILTGFLARDRIFRTAEIFAAYESQARVNLKQAIEALATNDAFGKQLLAIKKEQ